MTIKAWTSSRSASTRAPSFPPRSLPWVTSTATYPIPSTSSASPAKCPKTPPFTSKTSWKRDSRPVQSVTWRSRAVSGRGLPSAKYKGKHRYSSTSSWRPTTLRSLRLSMRICWKRASTSSRKWTRLSSTRLRSRSLIGTYQCWLPSKWRRRS